MKVAEQEVKLAKQKVREEKDRQLRMRPLFEEVFNSGALSFRFERIHMKLLINELIEWIGKPQPITHIPQQHTTHGQRARDELGAGQEGGASNRQRR